MRARVTIVVLVAVALLAVGLILRGIGVARANDARVRCLNNMRLLHQVSVDLTELRGYGPKGLPDAIPGAIPPGTIVTSAKLPTDRLSWIADGLGVMEQSLQPSEPLGTKLDMNEDRLKRMLNAMRQPTNELAGRLDRAAKWDAGPNAEIGLTRLKLFTCPSNPPATPADSPALAQYVGLSGVGADAAELPAGLPVSPRAGCFRYDSATPLSLIHGRDGLDSTLLFAEVSADLGPWIRGGPATVRGYDDATTAKPPIGFDGQFGGNHPNGIAAVGYAGGAATFVTPRVSPAVFRATVTIAGGADEVLPPGD